MAKAKATSKGAQKSKSKGKGTGKPTSKHQPEPSGITSDKILWWSLHALVFLVPLAISNLTYLQGIIPTLNVPVTYDQFDIVKVVTMRGLALVGLGAWAWARLTKGGPLRHSKLDWWVLALLVWLLLTTITSIHPATAVFGKYRRFEGLISFITYAVVFFLTVQAVDRPQKMRSLARTLVVSGTIVAAYGVSQYFGVDLIQWGNLPFEANRAFATYGNPDLLGGFLMFPLPISLAMALSEKDHRWRWFYWVAFLIVVVAWLVAFVRGAWVGGAVSLTILIFFAFRKRTKLELPDRVALGVTGAAGAAVVARSLTSTHNVMNIGTRIRSIFQFDQGSALTRFEIWDSAWRATLDRPITGFGADTFRLVFPKYKPIEYVADAGYLSVADNVHNYPLQMASAIGIPGVILLYGVFVRALWTSAREALSSEGGDRMLLAGFWAATAGYLTHLVFGISVTGTSIFLWISMGMLMTTSAKVIDIGAAKGTIRTVVAGLVLVAVVVASFLNLRYAAADHQHLLSKIGILTTAERIEASKLSIERNPYNDMYRAELGLAYTELAIQHINNAEQARAAGADPTTALRDATGAFLLAEEALLDVIDFVPPEYDNYVFLSNIYSLAGTYLDPAYFENAVEIAYRGIEVEPFGPAVRVQGGRALNALGRYEETIEMVEPAADMDPAYAEPRTLLAQAYYELEDYEACALTLSETLDLQPTNDEALQAISLVTSVIETEVEPSAVTALVTYALAAEYASAPQALPSALEVVGEALADAPDDVRVLRRSATVYMMAGETETAIEVLEAMVDVAAAERYPLNVWPHETLAGIYEDAGDPATAIEWLEASIEVDGFSRVGGRKRWITRLTDQLEGQ